MEEPTPAEPTPPASEAAAPGGRWHLVSLVPNDAQEPPFNLDDARAEVIWSAISAPWHPALLADAADLPRIEDVDFPTHPDRDEIRVVVADAANRLPSGYETQAADIGAALIDGEADRNTVVRRIFEAIGGGGQLPETDPIALDFMALGAARWWLRDLTIGMGHSDLLDVASLTREALSGARSWRDGDRPAARNRLRAAFEVLTQARERVYPVDAYILDLCLLDPSAPSGALADALEAHAPFTIIAPARAIEAQAQRDPERMAALRAAINDGWADVAGGTYGEADDGLRPLESILWQLRKGSQVYRTHLDDRAVDTLARRRFGLFPQMPQIAKRFGFQYALHFGLDDGRFPHAAETKRLWEAPDGSHLEALTRLPVAADHALEGSHLAWRLARTMKDDQLAVLPLVHWTGPVADWFRDLRRVAVYSPVLARWATLNDFFHLTDRPWDAIRSLLDEYQSPYLAQAVARNEPTPISRRVTQTALRARVDGLLAIQAMARCLKPATVGEQATEPESSAGIENQELDCEPIENASESGRFAEAASGLDQLEPVAMKALAGGVLGHGSNGRAGFLVVNPAGVARRCPVLLPEAAADLRPEGPLRSAQFTDEGVWAVVDLPAHGFAWVPRETAPDAAPATLGAVGVKGRSLRNELMEVEIDERTGGIRALRATNEPFVRIGQQLAILGLPGTSEKPGACRMIADRFEIDYGGPALVQAWSEGTLFQGETERRLARFRQRYRLWSGRPILELEITLSELDAEWLAEIANRDPWTAGLTCRWAWPDPEAELRRTGLLAPEVTRAERPETPEAIELSTRRDRTAILFGGLAHHQRHGGRMLDTLLVSGSESARVFRLGVAIGREYPFHAVQDMLMPAYVLPTESGPPAGGPSGWLFQLDCENVAVTRLEWFEKKDGEEHAWGVALHVVETASRATRCRLRVPLRPTIARQTDFHGDPIVDLPIEGDTVQVDLTHHEIARIEVIFG